MSPNVHLCAGFEFELVPARCIMILTIVLIINSIVEKQQGVISGFNITQGWLEYYTGLQGFEVLYIINKQSHDKSLMNGVKEA